MNLPWKTRKHRLRLEALGEAREAACEAVQDAKASGCTQRQGHALARAREATNAVLRAGRGK